MRLAAGEILEGRSVTLPGNHPHIHLQFAGKSEARFRCALRQHLFDFRVGHKTVHHRTAGNSRDQDIEIPDRFFRPPITSRCNNLLHPGRLFEIRDQSFGVSGRDRQFETLLLTGPGFQVMKDIPLGFFSETPERSHAPLLRRLLQLVERPDAEIVIQRFHPFRSDTGDFEQFGQRRGHRPSMFFKHRGRAGLDNLLDLRRQVFADSGQFGQILPLLEHRSNITGEIAQRASRIAIGTDAERIGAFNFEKVRQLIEVRCDIRIVYRHRRPALHSTTDRKRSSQTPSTFSFSRRPLLDRFNRHTFGRFLFLLQPQFLESLRLDLRQILKRQALLHG